MFNNVGKSYMQLLMDILLINSINMEILSLEFYVRRSSDIYSTVEWKTWAMHASNCLLYNSRWIPLVGYSKAVFLFFHLAESGSQEGATSTTRSPRELRLFVSQSIIALAFHRHPKETLQYSRKAHCTRKGLRSSELSETWSINLSSRFRLMSPAEYRGSKCTTNFFLRAHPADANHFLVNY